MANLQTRPEVGSGPAEDRPGRTGAVCGRMLADAAVGGGLLVALAVVFALDRATSKSGGDRAADMGGVKVVAGERVETAPAGPRLLRLAVTPPEYDDMGKLLDTLGPGYRYTQIPLDDLLDAGRLAAYDVVFLTCGGVPRAWLERRLRDSDRGGKGLYRPKAEIVEAVRQSFRRFVGQGGTLYASDLQFDLVSLAFPELVDDEHVGRGEVQEVVADVVDPGLRRLLGPAVELCFDMPAWRPAAFCGPDVTIHLRGTYRLRGGHWQTGPLLVTFPHGEGTVVFTSFHNEAQNTRMELELLRYLVFTSVTAREQARIRQTMVRGGFSPAERSLLSAGTGAKPVEMTYTCRRRGPLRFVLGFEDQGGKLRLTVAGPDGRTFQRTGEKTFSIDVPDAAPGTWRYTITPLVVPYENFPFTLTVGERP